jgi:cell division septation protein DedD
MAKSLSERIAERMSTKQPSQAGKNRAAFLAVRDDVKKALNDGWPIKVVWATLRDEGRIAFGYDAFIKYVNQLVRQPEVPPPARPAAPAAPTPTPKASSSPAAAPTPTAPAPARPSPEPTGTPAKIASFNFNPTPNKADLL